MLVDILAFSRKPTICFTACDLAEIIRDCLANCTTIFEDRAIQPSLSGDDCAWGVSGDAYQLKQVFLNLILNACDVMPEGGELVISLTQAEAVEGKKIVTVRIEDCGGGIRQEMLPYIFNPFFTTKHHGTGLGLAIAHRTILNHHGTINVHNTARGAAFTITLPQADKN
jgi:signal transduction histidine kinase